MADTFSSPTDSSNARPEEKALAEKMMAEIQQKGIQTPAGQPVQVSSSPPADSDLKPAGPSLNPISTLSKISDVSVPSSPIDNKSNNLTDINNLPPDWEEQLEKTLDTEIHEHQYPDYIRWFILGFGILLVIVWLIMVGGVLYRQFSS